MRAVVALLAAGTAPAAAQLADGMLGTWRASTVPQSVLGPIAAQHSAVSLPKFLASFTAARDPATGDYWMSLLQGQTFRVSGDKMQYCFIDANGAKAGYGGEQAPFVVHSVDDTKVQFCWRNSTGLGGGMPTHKKGCSGCDCAQITVTLTGKDTLEFLFQMSPPVVHAHVVLARSGAAPTAPDYYRGILGQAACEFENHTGSLHPEGVPDGYCSTEAKCDVCCSNDDSVGLCTHCKACIAMKTGPCADCWAADAAAGRAKPCLADDRSECHACWYPATAAPPEARTPTARPSCAMNVLSMMRNGSVDAAVEEARFRAGLRAGQAICWQLDGVNHLLSGKEVPDVRMQYTLPSSPCMPCNINYTVSAAVEDTEYIAVGFQGLSYFAYDDWSTRVRPSYFGMATDALDKNATTGAIALGYTTAAGAQCLREMEAVDFVGAPKDVDAAIAVISGASVERSGQRTVLSFSVPQYWGATDAEVQAFASNMRVMWAIGAIEGGTGSCDETVGFHTLHRGVNPQYWLGVGNLAC